MSDLARWVGREQIYDDTIGLFPARGMLALLDRSPASLADGSALPPLWHWLYFKPLVRRSNLGEDGHERLGGFLPPVPLPRRMWAGGTVSFPGWLRLGAHARRRSVIASVEEKHGRTGRLVFVNVDHHIESEDGLAVRETQNIVYREALAGAATGGPEPRAEAEWSEPFSADAVELFRFSALTFNGHRIHYDLAYANAEGYSGLVVHGPLLALLMLDAAMRHCGRTPSLFSYRAHSPLFAGEPLRLEGNSSVRAAAGPRASSGGAHDADAVLWVAGPRGVAMTGSVEWQPAP